VRENTGNERGRGVMTRQMGGESFTSLGIEQALDQLLAPKRLDLAARRQDGRRLQALA
jgi:hypothetical protein